MDDTTRLRALAAAIRAGDEAAFESLFRSEYARLCAFATALVHAPDIAEEIVQGVFVSIWANRAGWTVPDNPRAYLARAVRNHALNHLARRRTEERHRGRVLGEARTADAPAADDPIERMSAGSRADRLARALDALPPKCREVMILRWHHQLKHREIAEALGITVKAVESHLARGLAALRKSLDPPD